MSIQGFLSDRSLIDATRALVNLEKLQLPCGYLDRDTIEFFVEPLEIEDLRTERLKIQYRPEVGITVHEEDNEILADSIASIYPLGKERYSTYVTDTVTLAQYPGLHVELDSMATLLESGKAHLITHPLETVELAQYSVLDYLEFKNDVLPDYPVSIAANREMRVTIDAVKLTGDETNALSNMSAAIQERFFNIIEYITYGTISDDSVSDVNAYLAGNVEFTGYVPNSVNFTYKRTVIYLFGGINIHRYVPTSVEFTFMVGVDRINVKIWIDKAAFKSQYPISTIINIIPPMDLEMMLNPTVMNDPIQAAILSKGWTDRLMQPELGSRDQSGMYQFETRYIYNGQTYQTVFSLIYRGRQPDSLEARSFIAEYLLNSGIGTRALWEVLFPDIFYRSAFLLIPFYDNFTRLTNSDVYPSIIRANELIAKIDTIASLIPRATDESRELMTAAYDKYFIGVAPADVNEESSLLALHPTYRDFSTTDPGFSEMTAADREWSVRLNQALSMAAGESNVLNANFVTNGGLEWVNFTYDYVSYFIMTEASYKEYFNIA